MNNYCIKETTTNLNGNEQISYLSICGKLIVGTQTIITGASLMLNIASKESKMHLGAYYETIEIDESLKDFETVEYKKDYIEHLI